MTKFKNLNSIVLIDDDEATNFIHQMVIESLNIDTHIQICNSGKMGLEYLTCSGQFQSKEGYPQPGIIFLDINMPGMNGWEFLDKYEELPEEQKAQVVVAMLTTSNNPEDLKKSQELGDVEVFLKKPLEASYVTELIENNFKKE